MIRRTFSIISRLLWQSALPIVLLSLLLPPYAWQAALAAPPVVIRDGGTQQLPPPGGANVHPAGRLEHYWGVATRGVRVLAAPNAAREVEARMQRLDPFLSGIERRTVEALAERVERMATEISTWVNYERGTGGKGDFVPSPGSEAYRSGRHVLPPGLVTELYGTPQNRYQDGFVADYETLRIITRQRSGLLLEGASGAQQLSGLDSLAYFTRYLIYQAEHGHANDAVIQKARMYACVVASQLGGVSQQMLLTLERLHRIGLVDNPRRYLTENLEVRLGDLRKLFESLLGSRRENLEAVRRESSLPVDPSRPPAEQASRATEKRELFEKMDVALRNWREVSDAARLSYRDRNAIPPFGEVTPEEIPSKAALAAWAQERSYEREMPAGIRAWLRGEVRLIGNGEYALVNMRLLWERGYTADAAFMMGAGFMRANVISGAQFLAARFFAVGGLWVMQNWGLLKDEHFRKSLPTFASQFSSWGAIGATAAVLTGWFATSHSIEWLSTRNTFVRGIMQDYHRTMAHWRFAARKAKIKVPPVRRPPSGALVPVGAAPAADLMAYEAAGAGGTAAEARAANTDPRPLTTRTVDKMLGDVTWKTQARAMVGMGIKQFFSFGLTLVLFSALEGYFRHPDRAKIDELAQISPSEADELRKKIFRESIWNVAFLANAAVQAAAFTLLMMLSTTVIAVFKFAAAVAGVLNFVAFIAIIAVIEYFNVKYVMPIMTRWRLRENIDDYKIEFAEAVKDLSDTPRLNRDFNEVIDELGIGNQFPTEEDRLLFLQYLVANDLNTFLKARLTDLKGWLQDWESATQQLVTLGVATKADKLLTANPLATDKQVEAGTEVVGGLMTKLHDRRHEFLNSGGPTTLMNIYGAHFNLSMIYFRRDYTEYSKLRAQIEEKYPGLIQRTLDKNPDDKVKQGQAVTAPAKYPKTNRFFERISRYSLLAERIAAAYQGFREYEGVEKIDEIEARYAPRRKTVEDLWATRRDEGLEFLRGYKMTPGSLERPDDIFVQQSRAAFAKLMVVLFVNDEGDGVDDYLQRHHILAGIIGGFPYSVEKHDFIIPETVEERRSQSTFYRDETLPDGTVKIGIRNKLGMKMLENHAYRAVGIETEELFDSPPISELMFEATLAVADTVEAVRQREMSVINDEYWIEMHGVIYEIKARGGVAESDKRAAWIREDVMAISTTVVDTPNSAPKTKITMECFPDNAAVLAAAETIGLNVGHTFDSDKALNTTWSTLFTSELAYWLGRWQTAATSIEMGRHGEGLTVWMALDQRGRAYRTFDEANRFTFLIDWLGKMGADGEIGSSEFDRAMAVYTIGIIDSVDPKRVSPLLTEKRNAWDQLMRSRSRDDGIVVPPAPPLQGK